MDHRVPLASVVVALAIAGCGGGNGGSSTSYPDAASVAEAAGCSSFTEDPPGTYDADGGSCSYRGHDTVIQWFPDRDSMDTWKRTALEAMNTVTRIPTVIGPNWAIECHDKADCVAMKTAVGGSLS